MTAETPSLPSSGDLVGGRFRILEHVGTGGFGTVYRALQENVGRDVALKFLTPGVAKDPINVERFRREAYHVSQLRHPHTITLYDYGQTETGLVYMVMEFLEGIALADVIQNDGAIAGPRAAHIFIQVLKSLSEAHRRGLVHRDLKPENIFLCEMFGEKDYVKVLDFGVAKMTMMETEEEVDDEEDLTKAGRIFGTPMYMAPEQACAEPITPATDVYALGLLLFEMMTGKAPVTGRNRMDVIHKQIRDPVPVLTPELEGTPMGEVIRLATKKNQHSRFQDATQFLEAFVKALRQMRIFPAPLGGTSPEISVTGLGPEIPEEELAETPIAGKPAVQPDQQRGRSGSQAASQAGSQAGSQPKPPPIPAKPAAEQRGRRGSQAGGQPRGRTSSQTGRRSTGGAGPRRVHSRVSGRQPERVRRGSDAGNPRYELPLIGRDTAIATLVTMIEDSVRASNGQMIVIEGESGVGKSRLIRALRDRLGSRGYDVCIGHYRRRSLPMEGLREALAASWGVANSERTKVAKVIRQDLRSLGDFTDDEIAFVIEFVRPRALDHSQMPRSQEEAGALFARLEHLLLKLSSRRPFMIFLEDIQYCDSATLAFLEYLAVTLRTQQVPIIVLMTMRSEERGMNPDLEQSLREINANIGVGFTHHPLKRLRGRDLAVLLDAILPLEPRLKERVGWLSQGVPLHAIQIIRYLKNEGDLVKQGERWALREGSPREMELPPDLMDLMRLRIEQAVAKHRDVADLRSLLHWLAVVGMRAPVELMVALLAASGDVDIDSLDPALGALSNEGLIHQSQHQNMLCVEFDNSLLREALLQDLSDQWSNRRLHKEVAQAKLDFYRDQGVEVPLVEIAEHFRQAGEMDRYREALFEAAERAKRRFDLRGARERYRELLHALEERNQHDEAWARCHLALAELARRFGEFGLAEEHYRRLLAEDVVDGADKGAALRGLAHLLFVQRRNKESEDTYKQALRTAQASKNIDGVAKALIGLSRVYLMGGDGKNGTKVRNQLEAMLPKLPKGEVAGKVLLHLAEVAQRQGQLPRRHDYLVRARRELEHSGDRQGFSDALVALGSSLMDPAMDKPDRYAEAGRLLREALDVKRSIGDRHGVAEAFRYLGQLEIELGDYASAKSLLKQSLNIHEALGAPFSIGATLNALGITELLARHLDQADVYFDRAIELFRRVGDDIAISHAMFNKAIVAINRGDVSSAQTDLREARRMKEAIGSTWALFDLRNHLAICAMWLGEFERAEEILDKTLQDVDEAGTGEDRTVARSLMGLLRCFQSRLQLAALELGRARADAEDLGIERVTALCHANAAFYAKLTEAEGTYDTLLAQVTDQHNFHTLHRETWLELIDRMAGHARDREQNRQAVRLIRTAAAFCQRFGQPQRAKRLMQQAGELDAKLEALRT